MAVRRRRPLVPLPHPRRNLYGPVVGANVTHSVSAFRRKLHPFHCSSSFVPQTLRWFVKRVGRELRF